MLLGLGLVAGACTSDPADQPLPEPVKVEDCAGLVDIGIVYVQRMVLALDGLAVNVLTGDAEPPADIGALIDLGADLDERAARLDCDVAVLNAAILEGTADLDAEDDPVVNLFLSLVRGGVVADLPPSPAPTTTSPQDG